MKRYVLVAFVAIISIAIAAPAFAAGQVFGPGATNTTMIGGANFIPSTNVYVSAVALPSTDATNPNTYCVSSVHGASVNNAAGKAYGALNTDPGILHKDNPANTTECNCSSSVALPCSMIQ